MQKINVNTSEQTEMKNITDQIQDMVSNSDIKDGICYVFIPHTTAGITINENADPDVKTDIIKELNKIIPFQDDYRHFEGNSAAHIKTATVGSSESIFIENGILQLGRWQGIFFCEWDGPRRREVWIKTISS